MMEALLGQEHAVKKSKLTEDQIALALKQAELGTSVEEVCRKILVQRTSNQVSRDSLCSRCGAVR